MLPLDPRSVANLILDEAAIRGVKLTNLALQKILYFVHGRFLVEEQRPLVAGSFEAWQFGPVSLPVYEAFKHFGPNQIKDRAYKKNILTGELSPVEIPQDKNLKDRIVELAIPYLKMSPGRLVELSHASNSPWDQITGGTKRKREYGMRISNENILENFRFHKISVREFPRLGEPDEESTPD
ncbi:MAG: DUF4065 domain-containing protein [Pseudomonadota bacterium]|nr:DUF4065 domain-containing protein [Pseudomonadota bacterium]